MEGKIAALEKKTTEVSTATDQTSDDVKADHSLQLEEQVKTKETEKESIQGELDDMLMVYADTEEKLNKYKEKLRAKGEAITDDEDEGDDDDEDEGDEEADEDGADD